MIKVLSLAAALAVLPLTAAHADPQGAVEAEGQAEAAIESAASRFEARMEEFGERAEALGADETLTEAQREVRIAALWADYAPDVEAFTGVVAQHAADIANQALAAIDIEAVVADAMAEVDLSGALKAAGGMASNGAWASNDPEHMATLGLMADYAMGGALDAVDEALAEIETVAEPAPGAPRPKPAPPAL